MPIKGKALYPFRWFWRQDSSTQTPIAPLSPLSVQPPKPPYAIKKKPSA